MCAGSPTTDARDGALQPSRARGSAPERVAAANDPAIRVITIEGEGEDFTAGNDLADFLTALPNRALLRDRISQAIALAKRHSEQVAVLYKRKDGNYGLIEPVVGGNSLVTGSVEIAHPFTATLPSWQLRHTMIVKFRSFARALLEAEGYVVVANINSSKQAVVGGVCGAVPVRRLPL